jgi:hypothetical protein
MEDRDDKPGFTVTDRRRFTDEAVARDADAKPAETPGGGESAAPVSSGPSDLEPVTFSTFVLGLSTQALMHLGEIENPIGGTVERNLDAAKDVIDVLGILREKTRNNLELAEERLLDSILYDLRLRYVALSRAPKKEEA